MAFTTMPFGKNKGVKISEIDDEYLQWALEQDYITGELRDALEAEGARRDGREAPPASTKTHSQQRITIEVPDDLKPYVREIISTGYQFLSKAPRYSGAEELSNLKRAGFFLKGVLKIPGKG